MHRSEAVVLNSSRPFPGLGSSTLATMALKDDLNSVRLIADLMLNWRKIYFGETKRALVSSVFGVLIRLF